MMSPTQTITFVIGIIACAVGVMTFVSGMLQRSKNAGALENKVDTILKKIENIEETLNEHRHLNEEIRVTITEHEQKITTLFKRIDVLEKKI